MDIQTAAEKLGKILVSNIKDDLKFDRDTALMFSGGVDSTTLAVIARKYCDLKLYISGIEGSHDIEWGTACAEILDIPYDTIIYKKADVLDSLKRVVVTHNIDNPKWISTFVAFDLVLQRIGKHTVICGQGADEIFAGYRKYRDIDETRVLDRMKADYEMLKLREMPAYRRMAGHYGSYLLAPFLEENVWEFALSLPLGHKLGRENKKVLRTAARYLGVPGAMADKPKKAMQYGSGVSKVLKKHIRNSGTDLEGIIESIKSIQKDYE